MAKIAIKSMGRELVLEAADWKGSPTNPYSFEEMGEKFRTYASGVIEAEAIGEVIGRVATLEDEPDTSVLARLLSHGS